MEITDAEALAVIGCIILALKHPENSGPCAKLAREWARNLAIALINKDVALPAEILREWEEDLGLRMMGSRAG